MRDVEAIRTITNRKYNYFEALQELQKEEGNAIPDLSILRAIMGDTDEKN